MEGVTNESAHGGPKNSNNKIKKNTMIDTVVIKDNCRDQ